MLITPDMWAFIGTVDGEDGQPVKVWQHGSDVIIGTGGLSMCLPVKLGAEARKDFQLLFGKAERRADAWDDGGEVA
jgi:hypothetical protein